MTRGSGRVAPGRTRVARVLSAVVVAVALAACSPLARYDTPTLVCAGTGACQGQQLTCTPAACKVAKP